MLSCAKVHPLLLQLVGLVHSISAGKLLVILSASIELLVRFPFCKLHWPKTSYLLVFSKKKNSNQICQYFSAPFWIKKEWGKLCKKYPHYNRHAQVWPLTPCHWCCVCVLKTVVQFCCNTGTSTTTSIAAAS